MKIKLITFISVVLLLLIGLSFADDRSVPYLPVNNPQPTATGDKIEVMEFFWYGCPHCYSLEPGLEAWIENIPEDVKFRRVPGILAQNWIPLARAYFVAEKLGIVDKIHRPLFDAIHKEGEHMNDINVMKKFFAKFGVDEDEFVRIYESDEVQDQVKLAYIAGQKYGVTGVPTLIVNGKYMTSPSIAGGINATFAALNMLIEKERSKPTAKE